MARLRVPYLLRNNAPTAGLTVLGDYSDVVILGGDGFAREYLPVREGLVRLLDAREQGRDWARLIDIAFTLYTRTNVREDHIRTKLADEGELPREDVRALSARGIESEALPMPVEYLSAFIQTVGGARLARVRLTVSGRKNFVLGLRQAARSMRRTSPVAERAARQASIPVAGTQFTHQRPQGLAFTRSDCPQWESSFQRRSY
jgi:hypothetical protein